MRWRVERGILKVPASVAADLLRGGKLKQLFLEELGWDQGSSTAVEVTVDGDVYSLIPLAEKRGMVTFECNTLTSPPYRVRRQIETKIRPYAHEHLLVFTSDDTGRQVWQWVKREPGRPAAVREHTYDPSQPGEALLQKLALITFALGEEEDLTVTSVAARARQAFDVERVTRHFYERFREEHGQFLAFIEGIGAVRDREWYASVTLNRLMFVYFIQKKGFLDNDRDYLRNKLKQMQQEHGHDQFLTFFRRFLLHLFHEGLARRERRPEIDKLLGHVPYLNGGLFEVHQLESAYPEIDIPDAAFERLFDFFDAYQWHLDERPVKSDNEINPDVLGYIFEKYVNQKQLGAYYTKDDITEFMARSTIMPWLLERARDLCQVAFEPGAFSWRLLQAKPDRFIFSVLREGTEPPLPTEIKGGASPHRTEHAAFTPETFTPGGNETWWEHLRRRERVQEVRQRLQKGEVKEAGDFLDLSLDIRQWFQDLLESSEGPELVRAVYEAVTSISICDPTCGSGAFLFAALNVLEPVYEACLQRMAAFVNDADESGEDDKFKDFREILDAVGVHPNERYFVYKSIIINNLFGVDILEEAIEICKLRLFLKLVAQVDVVGDLEPLPDIDFNILAGNSLVGFASSADLERALSERLDLSQRLKTLEVNAQDADELFATFRSLQTSSQVNDSDLATSKSQLRTALETLDNELNEYVLAQHQGGTTPAARLTWLESHRPFHWFTNFFGVLRSGGFDVIIGNPPYVGMAASAVAPECGVGTRFATLFADYETVSSGNLYALVLERSQHLLAPNGNWSFIVPLSLTFSGDFDELRALLLRDPGDLWHVSFDNIPDRAFTGAKESSNTSKANQQRVTIFVSHVSSAFQGVTVRSAPLLRWRPPERQRLFADVPFVEATATSSRKHWPKLADSSASVELLEHVSRWPRLGAVFVRSSKHALTVPKTAGYYIAAYSDPKERSKQMTLRFKDAESANIARVLLNSNFFFWWYRVFGDGFDVTGGLVASCPMPPKPLPGYDSLAKKLVAAQEECTVYKAYRGERVPNVNYNLRMDLLHDCDSWVLQHVDKDVDWTDLLRYKSSSWFSFEIAKSQFWPDGYAPLAARNKLPAAAVELGT